ncbi:TRAP transporter substrate-binding protein DctP [Polaromonas sp.]|uniref:TRAP transporter substrate-binding protein DctP n=1 Tax=Polaromonas sp. TaxID=1869339 RepID=UPI001DA81D48|nr:TRAP transporter substrate-binding protein DctP [Polaromonas sp.]MBT9476173.1 TRAP transporter substrate-binding protein DctP [Polaromonas sp.]
MKLAQTFKKLLLVVATSAVATAPAWGQTKVRLAYGAASNHFMAAAKTLDKEFTARTGGNFAFEHFPASALGSEREMLESMQLGAIDLLITTNGPMGNFVKDFDVLDVPFLFRDYGHARRVLDGAVGDDLLKKLETANLVGLAWGENGFSQLTNNRRAVKNVADLKGLKIRTKQNETQIIAFRALGALPTPMAWTELFTALQQGAVDGQENPLGVITGAKFQDIQKHITLTNHAYSAVSFIASPKFWGKLTAEQKATLKTSARLAGVAMRNQVDADDVAAIKILKDAGVQIVEKPDMASFQTALVPTNKTFEQRFGAVRLQQISNVK